MGDPVTLVAVGRKIEVAGEPHCGLLDVVGWPKGADADAHLITRGKTPGVAGADVAGVEPHLQILSGPGGVDLEASRQAGVRRLNNGRVGQHATPAECVYDQRSAHLAAIDMQNATWAT